MQGFGIDPKDPSRYLDEDDARIVGHAWGKGAEVGFTRVRSDNPHVKLRGIALWLTVAYFETKDSEYGEAQNLHRQLMRTLRVLREYAPATTAQDRWTAEIGRAVA